MVVTRNFSKEPTPDLWGQKEMERSRGNYKVGDILKRRIDPFGVVNHYGVFMGMQNGVELVFDIKKKGAIAKCALYQLTTLRKFEKGRRSRVVRPFSPHGDPEPVLRRIHDLVQQGEMIFDTLAKDGWNCQQVAYWVVAERPYSPEAEAFHRAKTKGIVMLVGALMGFVASYVSERKKSEQFTLMDVDLQEGGKEVNQAFKNPD